MNLASAATRSRADRRESVGRRAVARLQRRREDRTITGASAEISGELVTKPRVGLRRARMVGGEQAHHDPGRAEAALRGVNVDHRLLQRMQFPARGEILDRDQFRAVELAQEQNTGVERLVSQPASAQPRQHHRACAAIPFGAAFLRSVRSHLLPQPVEDGRARGELSKTNLAASKTKTQRISRGWHGVKRHDRSYTLQDGAFVGKTKGRKLRARRPRRRSAGSSVGDARAENLRDDLASEA